jgi:putative glutamine amidotransferase
LPFVVGVQWHPEELAKTDQHSNSLFYDFIHAAANDWRSQVPEGWPAHFQQLCAEHERPMGQLIGAAVRE